MPEFHMPLALKIIKISECLCHFNCPIKYNNIPESYTTFARKMPNFT